MDRLKTSYLGLSLKNPLIVGSCSLTNSVEKVKKLESAGAAAVVLKSLFEEQMLYEIRNLQQAGEYYPEAADYLQSYVSGHSVAEYLKLISDLKQSVSIPVIASVNCVSASGWIEHALKMQQAGADAIEVNIYFIPTDKYLVSEKCEALYFDIAAALKKTLGIPLVFKLGNHFTNLSYMVDQLYCRGVHGVVLFNRFYEPDIDTRNMSLVSASVFSSPDDLRYSLRWVSIVSAAVKEIQISASTGIANAQGVIKMLLAGAQTTQVCSALYKKGPALLKTLADGMLQWMEEHHYKSIDEFRGKLNYRNIANPEQYERSQFMKNFSNRE
ncbi:MAG: dihydroorotate dehydrogenase-like protein [Bacteroidales bacterium]|jgi:dihydroorotate dehydrogenase (fumarate)|nr:dihydroorotate dehydrogenase-like protein [Bacteroidales bacterium]